MLIERGSIFFSDSFQFIDHGKFFVVIGENKNEVVGSFFINSNIRNYLMNKPKLLDLQVGLGCSDYSFLTHNSYLDCSQIIRIDKNALSGDLASGNASYRGRLKQEDLDNVLDLVRSAEVFSPADKEFFK